MKQTAPDAEMLKNSVNYHYKRFSFRFSTAMSVGFILIILSPLLSLLAVQPAGAIACLAVMLLLFAPICLYYYFEMRRILRDPGRYTLLEGTLQDPTPNYWGMVRFKVKLKDGRTPVTPAVFATSSMSERSFSEWNGKRVRIAWDEEGDRLIVLMPPLSK